MSTMKPTSVMSVIATTSDKVSELVIRDGQLIFVRDAGWIALDFDGDRRFYNQIVELESEAERSTMESPKCGYYFVVDTAIMWSYNGSWIQVTAKPSDIITVGTEFPELGEEKHIYINTSKKSISVWDKGNNNYVVVADKTDENMDILDISKDDILSLFS